MPTTPRHGSEPLPAEPVPAEPLPAEPLPAEPTASGHVEPAYGEPTAALGDNTPERRPIGKNPAGIKHTRAAATYTGLIVGTLILVVLLIFIVQNIDKVPVHFLGWTINLPLGVSMLMAAILGALIMGFAGGVRILQIRRAAKRK